MRRGASAAQAWSDAACYRDDHVVRRDSTNAKARDLFHCLPPPAARPPAARRPQGAKPPVPATRFAGLGARSAINAGKPLGARPGCAFLSGDDGLARPTGRTIRGAAALGRHEIARVGVDADHPDCAVRASGKQ